MADTGPDSGTINPSQILGHRSGRSRPIDSVDDGGTERLAVSAAFSGVVEANLDVTADEVAVYGGVNGSETADAATRQIVNVSATGVVRVEGVAGGTTQPVSDGGGSLTVDGTVSVSGAVTVEQATAASLNAQVQGAAAHDAVIAGNPVRQGARAIAHGTNPTAVAAGDATDLYANRAGVPFVIGGHPNVQLFDAVRLDADGAAADVVMLTVNAGTKFVATRVTVTVDEACTVGVAVAVGFAALSTTANAIFSHPGMVPGSIATIGDGSGILAIGADAADLVYDTEDPVGGAVHIQVSGYTIES